VVDDGTDDVVVTGATVVVVDTTVVVVDDETDVVVVTGATVVVVDDCGTVVEGADVVDDSSTTTS
jgi:hypothetical protein